MTDLQEGHKMLEHASKLGPKRGMAYLNTRFAEGKTSVSGFLLALRSYTDPTTGEIKGDAPVAVRLLAEEARRLLLR